MQLRMMNFLVFISFIAFLSHFLVLYVYLCMEFYLMFHLKSILECEFYYTWFEKGISLLCCRWIEYRKISKLEKNEKTITLYLQIIRLCKIIHFFFCWIFSSNHSFTTFVFFELIFVKIRFVERNILSTTCVYVECLFMENWLVYS